VIISDKYKFMFIHIPKTGGSTVTWRFKKIINNPDLASQMANYSRTKAIDIFSWDSRIEKYLSIYDHLTTGKNPTSIS